MTSARTSPYFSYILFQNNQLNVLSPRFSIHCKCGSAVSVLPFLLPPPQGAVSILTIAHLVGYMKVRRVEIND